MPSNYLNPIHIYIKSILGFWFFTSTANYLQIVYVIGLDHLEPRYFIAPFILGSLFGIMTGYIILLNHKLKWYSIRDPLTQAYNHGYYKEMLNNWCRDKTSFSLILVDIDFFKEVNDTYGHQVGDEALVRISEVITETKRTYDIFARHGGEEFVLLTPRADLSEAAYIATRLCDAISSASMPLGIHLTCSFGVAEFKEDSDSADMLFGRADKALYRSKNNGRNQVTLENAIG